jgi:hypothetical protein
VLVLHGDPFAGQSDFPDPRLMTWNVYGGDGTMKMGIFSRHPAYGEQGAGDGGR